MAEHEQTPKLVLGILTESDISNIKEEFNKPLVKVSMEVWKPPARHTVPPTTNTTTVDATNYDLSVRK